jgi:hypothetical protein
MNSQDSDQLKKGGVVAIVVAIISTLGIIIVAIINNLWSSHQQVPTPSLPSNPIPTLHGSYSGTFTIQRTNTTVSMYISSLSEQNQNGSFMAGGSIGGCGVTYTGSVSSRNTVSFYGTQSNALGCDSIVVTFYGQLFSDGHMGGNWTETNSSYSGTWTVS